MRIERVHAAAFGPFSDRTLTLAPHMTVVYGANEAGKSSWQWAIYAALCGRRRSRGALKQQERALLERCTPWNGNRCEVSIVVRLEDGREIEIRQELVEAVQCKAFDLTLGRDISKELENDGTPDGARLLGLTRDMLPHTIVVGQAQVLEVLSAPDALQTQLQRAASTGTADGTAEEAIQKLKQFHRDRVGLDRSGAKRPLRVAKEKLEAAESHLRQCRDQQTAHFALGGAREQAVQEARRLDEQCRGLRAAIAAQRTRALADTLERAKKLIVNLPSESEARDVERSALMLEEVREGMSSLAASQSALESLTAATPADPEPIIDPPADANRSSPNSHKASTRSIATPIAFALSCAAILIGVLVLFGGHTALGALLVTTGGVALVGAAGSLSRQRYQRLLWERSEAATAQIAADYRNKQNQEREAFERGVEQARERHLAMEQRVGELAARVGVTPASNPAVGLIPAVRGWLEAQEQSRARALEYHAKRTQLAEVLGGRTVLELEQDLAAAQTQLAEYGPAPHLAGSVADLQSQLARSEKLGQELWQKVHRVEGELKRSQASLPDIADAEERMLSAETDLLRVHELDEVLSRTLSFLEQARERVQKDIAPRLRDALAERLPLITGGRYRDVAVDPQTLNVSIRTPDGDFRPATQLSHGTAEQIYLLLRVAIAEHLTTTGEPAPLILDDVTVHSDRERTYRLLSLLQDISAERQVIVFSQEEGVRAWAHEHLLSDSAHGLVELVAPA